MAKNALLVACDRLRVARTRIAMLLVKHVFGDSMYARGGFATFYVFCFDARPLAPRNRNEAHAPFLELMRQQGVGTLSSGQGDRTQQSQSKSRSWNPPARHLQTGADVPFGEALCRDVEARRDGRKLRKTQQNGGVASVSAVEDCQERRRQRQTRTPTLQQTLFVSEVPRKAATVVLSRACSCL